MNNPWELYSDHPDFAKAEDALEAAWIVAKSIAPEKPSAERATLAERLVYAEMSKWSEVGATDTEPVAELRYRVRKHFGTQGDWL